MQILFENMSCFLSSRDLLTYGFPQGHITV